MITDQKRTGGHAFPTYFHPTGGFDQDGMTLRDWFAGQALGGIIAGARGLEMDDTDFARAAFAAADAMLKVRKK